jgi:hypothetical protein
MQFGGQGKPPVGIIFDCDMGNGIDDVLALALLYGLQGKNESRVIGITTTKPSLKSANLCELIMRFYMGVPEVSGFSPPQNVGLALKGARPEDTPMFGVLDKQTPEGKPLYARGIHQMNDSADPLAVIRNALSGQYDQNAIVLLAGPATNLINAMALPGTKEWVAQKVRYLVVAAGNYPSGPPEFGIKADIPAAKKLFAEWPGQIFAVGTDVGAAVPFPGASIDKDFAWSPAHPVADAYRANQAMPYDAPSTSMAAALFAIRQKENYFKVSDPGAITVQDDGSTKFTAVANGKHRYLIPDPDQKEKIQAAYVELASAKPVPRAGRFRPPQKQQQKQEEKKPDEKKQ